MKHMTVMEKYPVFSTEIAKNETTYKTVDEVLDYLKAEVLSHPIATYIGEFDHYAHTSSLEVGEIAEDIKHAKNLLCCFGKVLAKPEVLAVRPRSIGVAEMADSFVLSFLEAPNAEANAAMGKWVHSVANIKE